MVEIICGHVVTYIFQFSSTETLFVFYFMILTFYPYELVTYSLLYFCVSDYPRDGNMHL